MMNTVASQFPDPDDFFKHIARIIRDCDRFSERLDSRLQYLLHRVSKVQASARASVELRAFIGKQALRGVRSVEIVKLHDGRSEVIVDRTDSFRLTPKQTAVLKLLIADDGISDDHLVPWKTSEFIRRQLGTESSPVSASVLSSSINRLRDAIERDSIYPRELVQVEASRMRFALRRRHADPADG